MSWNMRAHEGRTLTLRIPPAADRRPGRAAIYWGTLRRVRIAAFGLLDAPEGVAIVRAYATARPNLFGAGIWAEVICLDGRRLELQPGDSLGLEVANQTEREVRARIVLELVPLEPEPPPPDGAEAP